MPFSRAAHLQTHWGAHLPMNDSLGRVQGAAGAQSVQMTQITQTA